MSALALQPFPPELNLKQGFLSLQEDMPLSIVANDILGNMKDARRYLVRSLGVFHSSREAL